MTFHEVYREHFRFVWRSLRRLGVRESDCSDAAQDVFVVVHRRLAEYEGRARVTTWLFAICLRVASERRRLAHERRRADAPEGWDPVDESADVGETLERREAARTLEAILDELPLEQRAVFTMFELDQMTGDEIAEVCGVPLGTVYSRLRLAREAFQASIARRNARDRFRAASAGGRP